MSASKGKSASNETPELIETNKYPNATIKFRSYRMVAESNERKLKETEILIQQMKEEIILSRSSEKNLRNQITSAQDRLNSMQKMIKKFLNVSDQQRQNEKISQQIQKRVKELSETINKTREESQKVFQYVSKEAELIEKIKELETVLNQKTSECDLTKMEIQTLRKQKENMENEFQMRLTNLENELEKSIKKESEALTHYHETCFFYKQQIEDYEQKIKRYENERKSFLEDFEPPKGSNTNPEKFTLADSTVNLNMEDRSLNNKRRKSQEEEDESDAQVFQCSSFPGKPKSINFRTRKEQNIQKKQKPQLEFLSQIPDLFQTVNSAEQKRKRRLFSTNCNHYID